MTWFVYKQVREELESMGCQIKTGCEVRSVSRFNEGIDPLFLSKYMYLVIHEYF
jgi:hypothetical protein